MYPCAEIKKNVFIYFIKRWTGNCKIQNDQWRRTPVTFQFVYELCIKVNFPEM